MQNTFITGQQLRTIVELSSKNLLSIEAKLNELDSAIGDGDHGTNMSRGSQTLLNKLTEIGYDSVANDLILIGNTLISSIGGASGALYGTLLVSMGKHLGTEESLDSFIEAFDNGVNAMKTLGVSDVKQKTMLDVIVPVLNAMQEQQHSLEEFASIAKQSSETTINMKATTGRAAYLGDRSIGHLDPGAHSSEVIICSICEALSND